MRWILSDGISLGLEVFYWRLCAFSSHSPLATLYDCIGLLVLVSVGAGMGSPSYEAPWKLCKYINRHFWLELFSLYIVFRSYLEMSTQLWCRPTVKIYIYIPSPHCISYFYIICALLSVLSHMILAGLNCLIYSAQENTCIKLYIKMGDRGVILY